MDPDGTGRHTPPISQPRQGKPSQSESSSESIKNASPRGGLFVTPDPDDDISLQNHANESINSARASTPQFSDHDQVQHIRFAQEAMKREILLKRKSGAASIFESGRAKVQRPDPGTGSLNEELPSVEDLHHNMDNQNKEDHSWMEEGNGGNDADEREAILRNMDALEKAIENNEGLTETQHLEYLRASQRLQTVSRRLQKGKSFPRVHAEMDSIQMNDPMIDYGNTETQSDMGELLPAAPGGQKKAPQRRGINKTARDVHNSLRDREAERMARITAKAEAVGKGRAAKKGKGKQQEQPSDPTPKRVSKSYRSRMRNQWPEVDDTVQKLLASLIQSDTIKERMEQGDVEKGPDIVTTVKAKQLKELISSIPLDYDTYKAKNERKELYEASKAFGHGKVKARNGKWLLSGMKTELYHHQLLAANWMVQRELSPDRPHGGLLADAMGLGKTVTTLATMVGNPPAKQDIVGMRKASLIVVPASLLSQWEAEIKVHVDEKVFQKVMSYKASSRISTNILSDCDIVLTSFTEVMNSWPFPNSPEDKLDAQKLGEDVWASSHDSEKGGLQRVKWYRIVLDEAQAIKNHRSRTSVACHKLDSTYRWALSGTPVLNSLSELYPYFRFLRTNWANSFSMFKKNFGDPDANDATKRLNVILSVIMM